MVFQNKQVSCMVRKNKKNKQWVNQHINDPFVKKATGQGYRSRAVYKFIEIDQQDKLIKQGMTILDLGSAPGGWSQYIAKKIGEAGKLIAIDLLDMELIHNTHFIKGDFQDKSVLVQISQLIGKRPIDLVISDMAPNITGIRDVDEARYENILESVLVFCQRNLKQNGNLLVKLFEGSAAHNFRRECNKMFKSGLVRKPDASRSKSREYYYLAKSKKLPAVDQP